MVLETVFGVARSPFQVSALLLKTSHITVPLYITIVFADKERAQLHLSGMWWVRIKMISSRGPYHTEVSLYAAHGVESGQGE
jgi:hypothetical protein